MYPSLHLSSSLHQIRDLTAPELLRLSDVISALRMHHQPLAEALADSLYFKLHRGNNPIFNGGTRKSY